MDTTTINAVLEVIEQHETRTREAHNRALGSREMELSNKYAHALVTIGNIRQLVKELPVKHAAEVAKEAAHKLAYTKIDGMSEREREELLLKLLAQQQANQ